MPPPGWIPPTLWLYSGHGVDASSLQPLRANRASGQSAAEAFLAEAAPTLSAGPAGRGVPVQICGVHLRTAVPRPEVENEPRIVASLFLADVTCALFQSPSLPNMLVVAIIPLAHVGLQAIVGNAGEAMQGEAIGWFLVAQRTEEETHNYLSDLFSMAGTLRGDMHASYAPDAAGVIGEGAYATVHCMRNRAGDQVAVKKMNSGVDLEAIEREVATLLQCQKHEHCIGYYGIFYQMEEGQPTLSVIFELAPYGDILYKVLKYDTLSEATARLLLHGVMSGLAHIHSHDIIHRDIKAENVLLKQEETAIIADFGLATPLGDTAQMARRCGSPGYVAPEVCLGTPYDFKVDTFGAGIILYFMLSKEMPFSSPDRDTASTMRRTVKCSLHLHRPPWDKNTSRLRSLMRALICKDPAERIGAAASLQHPWFQPKDEKQTQDLAAVPEAQGVPSYKSEHSVPPPMPVCLAQPFAPEM